MAFDEIHGTGTNEDPYWYVDEKDRVVFDNRVKVNTSAK
jgi:hypothetical protein